VSEKSESVAAWEALFRAQVSVFRQLGEGFPTAELSFNEYDVLFNLSRLPGRKSRIRDLNRQLLLTQPSVSRLVDRLVARSLVRKEADPGDGRGTIVCLTDAGYELFRIVGEAHADHIHQIMSAGLDADQLDQLTRLTNTLRASSDLGR